jgi:hypothetical protein
VPIITFAACHLTCVHKGVFHKHGEIQRTYWLIVYCL